MCLCICNSVTTKALTLRLGYAREDICTSSNPEAHRCLKSLIYFFWSGPITKNRSYIFTCIKSKMADHSSHTLYMSLFSPQIFAQDAPWCCLTLPSTFKQLSSGLQPPTRWWKFAFWLKRARRGSHPAEQDLSNFGTVRPPHPFQCTWKVFWYVPALPCGPPCCILVVCHLPGGGG